jgi:hypothetical protein
MSAPGTRSRFGPALFHIKIVTADAVKCNLAARRVIERPIPAVVIDPKKAKYAQHQQAINDDFDRIARGHGGIVGDSDKASRPPRGKKASFQRSHQPVRPFTQTKDSRSIYLVVISKKMNLQVTPTKMAGR